jgi:hypothetical protein
VAGSPPSSAWLCAGETKLAAAVANPWGSSNSSYRAWKVIRFLPTCSRRREELVLHTYGEGNRRGEAGDGKAARAFYNGDGVGRRSSSKHWIGARGFSKTDQWWWLVRRRQLGWGQNQHGGNPIYRGKYHLLVEDAETNLLLTGNRNKLDWIEIDQKGETKYSPVWRTGIRCSALPGRNDSVLGYRGEVGWRMGERKGKKSNGLAGFRPKNRFQIRNSFFSNRFYKLQFNLNSNQIWILMISTRTIKYKSTSSHQEK